MRNFVTGFIMSLTMFSIFPMPQHWDKKSLNMVIPSLPLVGAIIGGLWFGLSIILYKFGIPLLLSSGLLFLSPLLLSGFIHIDGYMDTSDAIFSRGNLEKKRKILKDPHVGAFAVIVLLCYFILAFSSVYEIVAREKNGIAFLFIPVMSRCLSGSMLLNIKSISNA